MQKIIALLTTIFDIRIMLIVCAVVFAFCLFFLAIDGYEPSEGLRLWFDKPVSDFTRGDLFVILMVCYFWTSRK